MKIKASSLLKGNLIGLLVWILAVAILNVVAYLIFGDAKIVVSLVAFSIVGLFFRLLSFCHVLYCTFTDKEIDVAESKDSAEMIKCEQSDEEVRSENTRISVDNSSDDKGSLLLGFFLIFILGVVLTAVGAINLKKEIRIFRTRSQIKSQGTGALGNIVASDLRIKRGTKGKIYNYYMHTVRYDGFEATFRNPIQVPIGATIPVVYLPERPEEALFGKTSQSLSQFKERKFGDIFGLGLGLLIYAAIALFGIFWILLLVVRGIGSVLHAQGTKGEPKGTLKGSCRDY